MPYVFACVSRCLVQRVFFNADLNTRERGSVVHHISAALSRFVGSVSGFHSKQYILYNCTMAMKDPKCVRNSEKFVYVVHIKVCDSVRLLCESFYVCCIFRAL
jgi:hypothetical protein